MARTGRPSKGLMQQRERFAFVMRTDQDHEREKRISEVMRAMQADSTFQDWIRNLVMTALDTPAQPKVTRANGRPTTEHYADPEESA